MKKQKLSWQLQESTHIEVAVTGNVSAVTLSGIVSPITDLKNGINFRMNKYNKQSYEAGP